jgi:peptide/nickel transport system substrate-binding protein
MSGMTLLTMALEKVDLLPPDRVTDNTSVLTLKNLVFEPLLGWDNGLVTPALFSHWTHSPDGRRWEFFIRPGATFHDGKQCLPIDILAIIEGVQTALDTFGMKWSYARYLAHAQVTAGTGLSVIVENPEPFADILDIFSELHIARTAADGQTTLGTGPYRIVDLTAGEEVTLERVDRGADARPPRIRLMAVPHAEDRWRMLQDGSVDAAIHLDHMEHPPRPEERFQWGRRINPLSVMLYLNCSSGIFMSPEARLAANLAVDKVELVRSVFHGLAEPASTIVSLAHLGMRAAGLSPIPHDPVLARALLEKIAGPHAIRLRTPTFMPERAPEISRFVADALTEVGFDVSIEAESNRPEYARQVGRKEIGDLALFDSSPHSTYRILNDKISSAAKAVWWQGYDNPEVQRLILAANQAVEPLARETAYAACLRQLRADPPWLYLVHPISLFAAKPGVARLSLTSTGALGVG